MPGGGAKSLFGDEQTAELRSLRIYVGLGESEKAAAYVPSPMQW
jgi:hypothetical protein